MLAYLEDLDLLVRHMKFSLAKLGAKELEFMRYGKPERELHALGRKLFTCLQALSYLRELQEDTGKKDIRELVSYILTLIDLEQVALEPYNLYLRPTLPGEDYTVLFANGFPLALNDNLLLLGKGSAYRELTLPQPLDPLPPTCC